RRREHALFPGERRRRPCWSSRDRYRPRSHVQKYHPSTIPEKPLVFISRPGDWDDLCSLPMERAPPSTVGAWVALPRGGYYVRTIAGPIQIGMPPETIK